MEDHKPSLLEKIEKIKMPVRILILVGTLVLLGGIFTYLVYLPKTDEIKKTERKVEELSRKLVNVKRTAADRDKFEERYKQVTAQFEDALKILPDSKEIPSLLTNITKLGNQSGLKFLLFNPQVERGRDFYKEIPVSIRVEGTYHDVARFFDAVGRMDRIVNILEVSMKPGQALSTDLITSCQAVTYQFTPESEAKPEGKKPAAKRRKK
ncbi:MAG: type 4a pilus biogenesis protein PilO [Thermodesulfobacteriota bacterium]